MRTNTTLKTKAMSILLAIVMLLGMLPISVFAADTTVQVTVDEFGLIEADSDGALPDGVSLTTSGYRLEANREYAFSGGTVNPDVINDGTILSGSFREVRNTGTIIGGTFNNIVYNYDTGTITGGTFMGGILNMGGTVAAGVNGTVAQGGDLAITMQNLGTGSITVKQNAIDIPSGKAGETYNVAASGGTLVGLYMLTEGETVPTENFEIDSDFRAVLGGAGGYDFTMPDEAVTIVAVFDDYEPEITEVNFFTYIIKGTDAENLENAQYLGDSLYAIDSLYSFTEDTVLPGDIVPATITHNSERYDFAGFILSEYDEATDSFSYSLSQTLTIPAEPAYGTTAWEEWKASVPEGLNAAYMLHTHNYVTKSDDSGHWTECSCEDKTTTEPHTYSDETDTTCDCGYTRTIAHDHSWGSWTSNGNGTHTRTCAADTSHTETANCSDGNDDGELCDTCGYDLHTHSYTQTHDAVHHWDECSCGDMQDVEKHKFTYTFLDNLNHTVGCEDCDYRFNDAHMGGTSYNYDDDGHWKDCNECKGKEHYGIHTYDDKYDRYCNGIIIYNGKGEHIGADPCRYERHTGCAADGDPFGQYSITDTAHERTCKKCGLTVRENHTTNTYKVVYGNSAAHTEVCVCGKSWDGAHTWTQASTHSSECTECGYYLSNHTYTAFKPSEANPETYHVVYCSVCGEMSDPVQVAGHNYEVKKDKDGHWNLCTDCGYTTAKTAHQTTVSQWEGTSLVHINTCSVCQHEVTENCDFKQGTYAGNEDGHWAVCFACGRTHSGIPLQAHVDENADGTCDVCGEDAKHKHSYTYTPDETKFDSHRGTCACGATVKATHVDTVKDDKCDDCGKELDTLPTDIYLTSYIPAPGQPSQNIGIEDLNPSADQLTTVLKGTVTGSTVSYTTDINLGGVTVEGGKTYNFNVLLAQNIHINDAYGTLTFSASGLSAYGTNTRFVTAHILSDGSVQYAAATLNGNTVSSTMLITETSPFILLAITEVEETPGTSDNPQTGDNSNMALWIALLFISGGAVITLTVYDRKRRTVNR